MAAIYHEAQGGQFEVPVGSLGFSVTIFCIEVCKIVQLILLSVKTRHKIGPLDRIERPYLPSDHSYITSSHFWDFWTQIHTHTVC